METLCCSNVEISVEGKWLKKMTNKKQRNLRKKKNLVGKKCNYLILDLKCKSITTRQINK